MPYFDETFFQRIFTFRLLCLKPPFDFISQMFNRVQIWWKRWPMKSSQPISIQAVSNDGIPICPAGKSNHDSCLTSLQILGNYFLKSLDMARLSYCHIDKDQPTHIWGWEATSTLDIATTMFDSGYDALEFELLFRQTPDYDLSIRLEVVKFTLIWPKYIISEFQRLLSIVFSISQTCGSI